MTPPLTTTLDQPRTGESATTPTGKWLQDQLYDDATAFYALTKRQYSLAALVVKVQDLIPVIERESAAQPAPPTEALRKALAFVVSEFGETILGDEAWTVIRGAVGVEETASPAGIVQALGYEWEAIRDEARRYLAASEEGTP